MMADMPAVLFAQTAEDLEQEPPQVFFLFFNRWSTTQALAKHACTQFLN